MMAALTFAICTFAFDKPVWYKILAIFAALVVIFQHRSNMRRIALRCENKVTFPWDHRGSSGSGQADAGGLRPGFPRRARHRHRFRQLGLHLRPPAVAQRPHRAGAHPHRGRGRPA